MTIHSNLDGSGEARTPHQGRRRLPSSISLSTGTDEEEEEETRDDEDEAHDEEEVVYTVPTREEAETLGQVELRRALEKLENMCTVLGVDYNKKLLEMGVTSVEDLDLDVSRVYGQTAFLQLTINDNYEKLKVTGKALLKEWELCDTPFKKMMRFAHVISVLDSRRSEDVIDAHFLSTLWLKKAQDEVTRLQKDRIKAEKKEYEKQRDRLKDMVYENHLSWVDVGFDPKKKVVPERYAEETRATIKGIDKAKELSVGRKELVFRVELVGQLIEQKTLQPHIIRGLLESAKSYVKKITEGESEGRPIMYDGDNVDVLLKIFDGEIDELEDKLNKEEEKKLRMQRIRTRYGRSPSPDASST